jgi:hypothetical protein
MKIRIIPAVVWVLLALWTTWVYAGDAQDDFHQPGRGRKNEIDTATDQQGVQDRGMLTQVNRVGDVGRYGNDFRVQERRN